MNAQKDESNPKNFDVLAREVAEQCGASGGVVIIHNADGGNWGLDGVTPDDLREILCCVIHDSYFLPPAANRLPADPV